MTSDVGTISDFERTSVPSHLKRLQITASAAEVSAKEHLSQVHQSLQNYFRMTAGPF